MGSVSCSDEAPTMETDRLRTGGGMKGKTLGSPSEETEGETGLTFAGGLEANNN